MKSKKSEGRPATDPAGRCRIFIVDDHAMVRDGLVSVINQEPDLVVCGQAASTGETLRTLSDTRPDLMIVDITLETSNGLELIKALRTSGCAIPVLVLSMHDETHYAERALKAGAQGYIMKNESVDQVLQAVRRVRDGDLHLSPALSSRLLRQLLNGERSERDRFGVDTLSDRELEVFEWIGRGLSASEIAAKLTLSIKTIDTHRTHIKEKLGLRKANELVHYAVRWIESGGKPPVE
jgi:DNA-binding NarL/FixJ family response regulator